MKKITVGMLMLSLIGISGNIFAEQGYVIAHVERVLISDNGTFGGCMAFLDKDLRTQATPPLNCSPWVTFSCSGTYNSKDIAYRKLDIAQKSEVTGHKAVFYIDDLKKHNGQCYAYRVDSLNVP